MSKLRAFLGADLFDGAIRRRDMAVIVQDDLVVAIVGPGGVPEQAEAKLLDGGLLAPGFVDLQVNGGGGVLLNEAPTAEGVRTILAAHARTGTTALLPTLITDTAAVTEQAISAVRDAIGLGMTGCIGIHLEGPHLSIARKGAHDPALIRPMDERDLERTISTGIGTVLTTVAAETVPPALIARLTKAGVHVSIGHSDASYDVATAAFSAGARGVTHLFNAMSQLGHREPGLVGAALDHPDSWCGLIADGFHVHAAAIRAALGAKRAPGRVFLVSDAMSTVGSSLTEITLNGRRIKRSHGKLTLEDGTLAGSDLDMLGAVRFMVQTIGLPLDETLRMATLYPAQFIGRDREVGRIAPGARADFVHLTKDLALADVFIGGERQTFPSFA